MLFDWTPRHFVTVEIARSLCIFNICIYACRRLSGVEVSRSTKTSSNVCLMDAAALPGNAALDQPDAVDQSSKDKKKKNMYVSFYLQMHLYSDSTRTGTGTVLDRKNVALVRPGTFFVLESHHVKQFC